MKNVQATEIVLALLHYATQSIGSRTNSMLLIRESVAYHYFFLPPVATLVRNYRTEALLGLRFDAPFLFIPGLFFHLYFPFWLRRVCSWSIQTKKQKVGVVTLGVCYTASFLTMFGFCLGYVTD